MAFEATKRELGELYTFFRLLADGKVFPGTPDAQRDDRKYWPVALIQREEHDGTRRYYIGEEDVRIVSGTVEKDGTHRQEKSRFRFPVRTLAMRRKSYSICSEMSKARRWKFPKGWKPFWML
mgnify:CR=1 FL=1